MRKGIALATAIGLLLAVSMVLAEEKKEAPAQIVYEAKNGPVTFDHAKHVEAAKNDCKACHPSVFAQAKGDLGYKGAMHMKAEAGKKSCAACHHPGGSSFQAKGNCMKCHQKK